MRAIQAIGIVVILIMLVGSVPNLTLTDVHAQTPLKREVTIPVKVVFVGIDPATVDTNYIKWGGNTPPVTFGQDYYPQPNLTGVQYDINYNFYFASNDYKSKLLSYLESIQVMKEGPNPWFYYYSLEPSGYVSQSNFFPLHYAVYDANEVESWMYTNQQELGGFPSNGWTLMFLNLTELPSYDFKNYSDFLMQHRTAPPNGTAHYYGVQYQDEDLGYQLRYRDYMTGWGAVHRFWFDDLSAGPSFQTYPDDLPLQIVLKDNNYDIHTPYGKTWLTQYLSDYVSQAVLNFVTPAIVYPAVYSEKYSFDVHVFDNRTDDEKSAVDIRSTVDSNRIKQAFQDLVPYSTIDVSVTFEDMSKYPQLQKVIDSTYHYANSFTMGVEFASPQQYGIIDARPLYKYFQDNMRTFEPNYRHDRSEQTIPVFVFAFSNETNFAFTGKWIIGPFAGVALGDLAFVGASQFDMQRGNLITPPQPNRGLGFTHDIIHESGHMLGLSHPHDWGPVGDFSLSVMGYYTYDYVFSQRDKDLLWRVQVDQIYLQVESMLSRVLNPQAVQDQLRDVDSKYSQMDYAAALTSVLKAEDIATSQLSSGTVFSSASVGIALALIAVGLVVGFAVAWVILNRRAGGRGTKQVAGMWSMCSNCGRALPRDAQFCFYCGQRQPGALTGR